MRRKRQRLALFASATWAAILIARTASASPDLVLDGQSVAMSGTVQLRYVRLLHGSRITVQPYDGQPGTTTGRLEILAADILIDATSEIDGTGAGYRGRLDADGEGLAGGQGTLESADATGGGAHAGEGGSGVLLAGCAPIPSATGGVALTGSEDDVTFGSAGAAAGIANGGSGGRGGNGGGAVVLRAGRIELSGKVTVDGQSGDVAHEDASGGGAGGGVLVEASYFLSFGGRISVLGASGGATADDEGGSGGGGRVLLFVPGIPADLLMAVQGGGASCAPARGGAGQVKWTQQDACLDVDHDGFTSASCGGEDCDDSDPGVNPGAAEACNGEDDDCSGAVDDHDAATSCPSGQCEAGSCAELDGGTDALGDGPKEAADDGAGAGEPEPEGGALDSAADAETVAEAGDDAQGDGGVVEGGESPGTGSELRLRGGCQAAGAPRGGGCWGLLGVAVLVFEHARNWSARRNRRRTRG